MNSLVSSLFSPGAVVVPYDAHRILHRRYRHIPRCNAKAAATLTTNVASSSSSLEIRVEEAVRGVDGFVEKALVECAENVPEITWSNEQIKEELGRDISRVFIAVEVDDENGHDNVDEK